MHTRHENRVLVHHRIRIQFTHLQRMTRERPGSCVCLERFFWIRAGSLRTDPAANRSNSKQIQQQTGASQRRDLAAANERIMKTVIQVPRILQPYCGGNPEFMVKGSTIGEVLEEIQQEFPSLHVCICDETGALRQHINLFINNDLLRDQNKLDARLRTGDIVSIFQAVSGG